MERDIRKLSAWLEETLRVGIADEQKVLEWRLAEKSKLKPTALPEELLKAS